MTDIVTRLEQGRAPASCNRPSEALVRCERGDCECAREDAREAAQMIRHLRGAMAADDARMLAAGTRVDMLVGCDTPEWMADEIERLRGVLHEIAEVWAGSECGEPVTAQEGYAITLLKRIYALAKEET